MRRDDTPFGRAVGEVRAEGLTRLAVVGRLADMPNLGDHRSSDVRASWVITPLAGPRDALPAIEVTHTDGSDLVAAVADASAADAAVVVVGYTAEDEGEYVGSFDPELATLDPPSEDPQALDGHPRWSTSFTIVGVSQPERVDRLVELARWGRSRRRCGTACAPRTPHQTTDCTDTGGHDMTVNPAPRLTGEAVHFPAGFAWGTATASYQIEGAVEEDGRSPSIWDTFSHTPGKVQDGDTGDVADDHYHRYEEDIELMAGLGVGWYRFSLAWPRLQPDGRGALNEAGVDFYSRLVDALLAKGIQPWVTLYHWDLPQVLQDEGGWPLRDTAERFAEYASAVYERLHDRVTHWTTLNEPWVSAFLGHATGQHAPGLQDPEAALRAAHHLMLGHGRAIEAMRAQGDADSTFGITLSMSPVDAASDDPADLDAARRADGLTNRLFLDPLLRGGYPADVLEDVREVTDGTHVQSGDEERINAPLDFLGINYYYRTVVRAGTAARDETSVWVGSGDIEPVSRGLAQTEMGWEIDPEGLYDLLARVARDHPGVPLYVTENGAAIADEKGPDGEVHDPARVAYLDAHFRAAHRAIADGVDLRGYFVWSLLDNFEWSFGYSKRFGLIHVDFHTLERTPKDSARWYAEVTRTNGLAG